MLQKIIYKEIKINNGTAFYRYWNKRDEANPPLSLTYKMLEEVSVWKEDSQPCLNPPTKNTQIRMYLNFPLCLVCSCMGSPWSAWGFWSGSPLEQKPVLFLQWRQKKIWPPAFKTELQSEFCWCIFCSSTALDQENAHVSQNWELSIGL